MMARGRKTEGRNGGSLVPASGVSLGRRPAAGVPALQCVAAEGGVVVAELQQLRQATSPGLDSVNRVLDRGDDLIIILDTLSRNTADANKRHTAHADIPRQSREEGIPEEAGWVVELSWRR